jgi:hypothetical protein
LGLWHGKAGDLPANEVLNAGDEELLKMYGG